MATHSALGWALPYAPPLWPATCQEHPSCRRDQSASSPIDPLPPRAPQATLRPSFLEIRHRLTEMRRAEETGRSASRAGQVPSSCAPRAGQPSGGESSSTAVAAAAGDGAAAAPPSSGCSGLISAESTRAPWTGDEPQHDRGSRTRGRKRHPSSGGGGPRRGTTRLIVPDPARGMPPHAAPQAAAPARSPSREAAAAASVVNAGAASGQ